MVIISSQPFSMASFSVNDSQLPAGIVISSGGTCKRRTFQICRAFTAVRPHIFIARRAMVIHNP